MRSLAADDSRLIAALQFSQDGDWRGRGAGSGAALPSGGGGSGGLVLLEEEDEEEARTLHVVQDW